MKVIKPISIAVLALTLAACGGKDSKDGEGSTSDLNNNANAAGSDTAVVTPVDMGGVSESDLEAAAVEVAELTDEQIREQLANMTAVYYFDFDQATLSAEARAALDQQVELLLQTNLALRIDGHTDARGTRDYNLALGERRAQSVANYLNLRGVDATRMEVISYGEEKPAVEGTGESVWQQNRRVEIKLK